MQKTKKVKKAKISYLRLIFFAIVLVMIARSAYGLITKHPRTQIVVYGNIEVTEEAKGYIFKNETIVNTPIGGTIKQLIPEGTRVQQGISVATVTRDGASTDLTSKIEKLNEEIAEIKNTTKQNNNIFQGDVVKLDADIADKIKLTRQIALSGNVGQLSQVKNQVNDLIVKKLYTNGDQGAASTNLIEKVKLRDSYSAALNMTKYDIPTSVPGILSFSIDGYEQILSPQNIKSITSKDLNNLKISEPKGLAEKVDATKPVAKIIDNFQWYLAVPIKSAKASSMKENDVLNISMNENQPITAKVYSIKDEGNGSTLIIFSLNKELEKFYNSREVDVKIIKKNIEGIKVPISSITNKNGKRGVMILDEGITKFKEVDLAGFDEEYAIVQVENQINGTKGLSLYNEIIINPSFIKEGKLIR